MVDLKAAATSASNYFALAMDGKVRDIRLEEVEISDDGSSWRVTLSGLVPAPENPRTLMSYGREPILQQLTKEQEERAYKLFDVDAATGQVRAMKIRLVQ